MAPRKKTPPAAEKIDETSAGQDKAENLDSKAAAAVPDEYAELKAELEQERAAKVELIRENGKLEQENYEIAQRNEEQKELIESKENELKDAKRERKAEEDRNSSLKDGGVPCTAPGEYRIVKGKAFKGGVCHTPDDNPIRVFRRGEIIGKNWEKV